MGQLTSSGIPTVDTVGHYDIPVDPMDDLLCDSCQ